MNQPEAPSMPARGIRWHFLAIGGGVVLLGAWGITACRRAAEAKAADPRNRPVPILAGTVAQGDLDLSQTSLGTVTALNAVTIRSRVDGHLQRFHFQEGQFVREGDLLAELDPRPFQIQLMQAEGQLARDQASAHNAKLDLNRIKALTAQGIASNQQLETQTATTLALEAAVKADQAAVESAKLNLIYARITSPVSGRVGLRLVEPGAMVRAAETTGLTVVAPTRPISVLFTIPADAIQSVLARQKAAGTLTVEAFDRDLKQRLAQGKLVAIDNQVDTATGTVKLRAEFPNADEALFPNQFVHVRLKLDTLKNVPLVPTAALQRSPQGTFAYVLTPDLTVDMRPVTLAGTEGETAAISKGLKPGERIAVDGLEKLRPGSKVTLPKEGTGKNAK